MQISRHKRFVPHQSKNVYQQLVQIGTNKAPGPNSLSPLILKHCSLSGLVWAVTPLVLSRVSENAFVHWFGNNDNKGNLYVPICSSDWDDDDLSIADIEEE